jgi:ArsR family transcriptional regulator
MPAAHRYNLARFFQALGNDVRLRLLNLIGDREICVCHLVNALELPQPLISQHLACLRSVGIVEARREGKWMHYRIVPPPHAGAAEILEQTLASFQSDKAMKAERNALDKACCGTPFSL